MDIKDYIQSGVLESYVIGTASVQEQQAVECLSHIYPEIKTELLALQQSLENVALADQRTPPSTIKEILLNRIQSIVQEQPSSTDLNQAQKAEQVSKSNRWPLKYLIAAVLLLAVFGAIIYQVVNDKNAIQEQNIALRENQETQNIQIESLTLDLEQAREYNAIISNPATQIVALAGTPKSPNSVGQVYWSPNTDKSLMKIGELPAPQADKQYQLWAIIDGAPTDMGVLTDVDDLVEINYEFPAEGVEAFAITLEVKGGNPTPTLDEMYVFGAT